MYLHNLINLFNQIPVAPKWTTFDKIIASASAALIAALVVLITRHIDTKKKVDESLNEMQKVLDEKLKSNYSQGGNYRVPINPKLKKFLLKNDLTITKIENALNKSYNNYSEALRSLKFLQVFFNNLKS